MIIYCIGCLLTVLFTYWNNKLYVRKNLLKRKHNREFLLAFFSGLPLIIISSIRYDVGSDYLTYAARFDQIAEGRDVVDFEYLFSLLNKIIATLGGTYPWLFAMTSIIFAVFVMSAALKSSPYPEFSAFLLVTTTYYFSAMNGIRQMMACAILLFSLRYVESKKIISFLVCTLVAIGFHTSSLLFIPIYFVFDFVLTRKFAIISTLCVAAISPLLTIFINYLISLTKYSWYLESIYAEIKSGGYITQGIAAIIIVVALVYYDREDKRYQLYCKLQIISFWLSFFVDKVPLIQRAKWIFGLPVIILVPMIVKKIKRPMDRFFVTSLIVLCYILYFFYSVGVNNSNTVLPYSTIFSHGF